MRKLHRIVWQLLPQLLPLQRRRLLQFYEQFVRPGDLCFDVGGNWGGMTEVFLVLGANVVVVEPQQSCLSVLTRKFAGIDAVSIVPKAVGSTISSAEMKISDVHQMSTLSQEFVDHFEQCTTTRWSKVQEVQLTTLDSLIETYGAPSFIKLDIEGYEYEALRGLNRPVPVLSFEFVEGMLNNVGRCVTILQQLAPMEFNHSTNEAEGLAQSVWTTGSETLLQLEHAPKSGNVYARIKD